MKKFQFKKRTLLLLTLVFTSTIYSQSISGNMRTMSKDNLAFGNVNVYQNGKKVAAVLTDAEGNFNVKLDTGYYEVELLYEGYQKMTKKIHVTKDNKNDFNLTKKKGYTPPVYESPKKESMDEISYSKDKEARIMFSESDVSLRSREGKAEYTEYERSEKGGLNNQKGYGSLTAGEVNDFSKWEMWQDIATNKLAIYQKHWDLFFDQRFTVQLKNEDGFPLVDATVQLLDDDKLVCYENRTDNTGKAELWGKMGMNDKEISSASARVYYGGKSYSIRRLTTFKNGVNTLTISTGCKSSSNVDIAFVVDATGSMGDEISYLKAELNHVIYKSKNDHPGLTFNFGNVFYRDQGDDYVTRRHDFTDVLSSSIDFITRQNAGGGGDYEEAVEIALNEALDSLEWSENARTRILFLVLDAPPHNSSETRQKLKDIARKAASKGIRIVPLAASGIKKDTEYLMRCFALGTNGTYAFLTNHSGIGNAHIDPSTDEYDVELLKDLMIRLIDSYTFVSDCNNETELEGKDPNATDSLITIDWKVWPNPTQGDLNIKIDVDVDELFITDITGKIMERFTAVKKNRVLKTTIAQFTKGFYLVTFTHEEKRYTKKVVLR